MKEKPQRKQVQVKKQRRRRSKVFDEKVSSILLLINSETLIEFSVCGYLLFSVVGVERLSYGRVK